MVFGCLKGGGGSPESSGKKRQPCLGRRGFGSLGISRVHIFHQDLRFRAGDRFTLVHFFAGKPNLPAFFLGGLRIMAATTSTGVITRFGGGGIGGFAFATGSLGRCGNLAKTIAGLPIGTSLLRTTATGSDTWSERPKFVAASGDQAENQPEPSEGGVAGQNRGENIAAQPATEGFI